MQYPLKELQMKFQDLLATVTVAWKSLNVKYTKEIDVLIGSFYVADTWNTIYNSSISICIIGYQNLNIIG